MAHWSEKYTAKASAPKADPGAGFVMQAVGNGDALMTYWNDLNAEVLAKTATDRSLADKIYNDRFGEAPAAPAPRAADPEPEPPVAEAEVAAPAPAPAPEPAAEDAKPAAPAPEPNMGPRSAPEAAGGNNMLLYGGAAVVALILLYLIFG